MKLRHLSRYALSVGAAALLAGCGGSQPPIVASGSLPSIRGTATPADLLYVSSVNDESVSVFNYSTGKMVQQIKAIALGLCSDSAGNVFMPNGVDAIAEYAHGETTPTATIYDSGRYPQACAIDPVTGNLAAVGADVANTTANVAVFPRNGTGFGTPTVYTDSSLYSLVWCAYDESGNLFANASLGLKGEALDELPLANPL